MYMTFRNRKQFVHIEHIFKLFIKKIAGEFRIFLYQNTSADLYSTCKIEIAKY